MSKAIDWERTESIWAENPKVIAAWAFGSVQGGRVRPGSDVDIGVLFETLLSLDEQLELLGKLQTALNVEAIDLVVLSNANPILRFEAISGRSLFCRNLSRRAEFASLTAREYEDSMALIERGLAAWKQAR